MTEKDVLVEKQPIQKKTIWEVIMELIKGKRESEKKVIWQEMKFGKRIT